MEPWSSEPRAAVDAALRERRTIHQFHSEVPDDALLTEALELACWAPNHRSTEPWRYYKLGPETVRAVVDLNARLVAQSKGAEAGERKRARWSTMPGWLCVTQVRDERPNVDLENYAAVCCAVQNLALALWTRGIGNKWGTGPVTTAPEFYELLGTRESEERVVGLFWYGYAVEVPRQSRRELGDVLRELP